MDRSVQYLIQLRDLLEDEHRELDRTSDLIWNYLVAVNLLIEFAQENNFNAFVLVFPKFHMSIRGVRDCVHESKKDRAESLLREACQAVLVSRPTE